MNALHTQSILSALAALALAVSASAQQINIPSDGSDGPLNASGATWVIDLREAVTAPWNTPSPNPGKGVYDPDQWAIVFKYESINIPSGTTVTFINHESRAPVIWLVQEDVTINGTVSLNGTNGHNYNHPRSFAEPGPGGFRGGQASTQYTEPAAGLGPGGGGVGTSGSVSGAGAGYGWAGNNGGGGSGSLGGVEYGNAGVFPLIGGSGGGGGRNGSNATGGGGGGGAILVATASQFILTGEIRANGGSNGGWTGGTWNGGGGSGGGIRIIAQMANGSGVLRAIQGSGGANGAGGRIRVEAFENNLVDPGSPAYSFGVPGTDPRIFRDEETPSVRAATLAGVEVPLDPESKLAFPTMDVQLDEGGVQTLLIQAENMPPSGTMVVRLVRRTGAPLTFPATFVSGDPFLSTWQAEVDLPQGFSAIQIRAVLPDGP